ncbi:Glycosyltransferase OS=Streptomyces cyaneofuscatus OX=66883 GN=G3I52_04085 PE=4 SV=1 [Streptomyces cyaneofuscatus]
MITTALLWEPKPDLGTRLRRTLSGLKRKLSGAKRKLSRLKRKVSR